MIEPRVAIVGAGLMGSQVGCEYALGGCQVPAAGRHLDELRDRRDGALAHDLREEGVGASDRTKAQRE